MLANTLYASGLGALQLARVGIFVKEAAPGVPKVGRISPDQVRDYLVTSALGRWRSPRSRRPGHEVACSAPSQRLGTAGRT
jgi:hypothetical protein